MSDPSPDTALRQEVLDAANRRFRRHGFKSVTMDDIARDLGRSKKTLYRVVANKLELIDLVVDADIARDDDAVERATGDAENAIDEMLRIARYFTESMREMRPSSLYDLQKYYRPTWERVDRHHNGKMIDHVRANLRRGQSEGLYRTDVDRELIARLFVSGPQVFLDESAYRVPDDGWGYTLDQWMLYHLLGVCSPGGRDRLTEYLEREPPADDPSANA